MIKELLLTNSITSPSIIKRRTFRGNFCGLPLDLDYAPNGILFTPAYVIYPSATRKRIRDNYISNGWTHFPISLFPGPIYGNYYPNWDGRNINSCLDELLSDGLVPVCFVMRDDGVTNSLVDKRLVPIAVPKWECSNPIARPALDNENLFYVVKQMYPDALVYWHNPPYQGAPYVDPAEWHSGPEPNAEVWNYMVHDSFVQGLLFQGKAWENNSNDSISRLNDFIDRLVNGNDGWPICDLIDFEETAYYTFDLNGSYSSALLMTDKIWTSVHSRGVIGYCNGN